MKHSVLVASLVLAGCQTSHGHQWGVQAGSYAQATAVDMRVTVPLDSLLGAILIGVVLADGTGMAYYGVPHPDPARRINVQDCTQPIDLAAGNLMCR